MALAHPWIINISVTPLFSFGEGLDFCVDVSLC